MNTYGYFAKRILAFLFDLYFSSVMGNAIYNLMIEFKVMDIKIAFYLSLCVSTLLWFLLIPLMRKKTQTIGQRFMRLKVVTLEGGKVSLINYMKRLFLGCFVLEWSFYVLSVNLMDYLFNWIGVGKDMLLYVVSPFLLFSTLAVLYALKSKQHQTLHDVIAHTKVVEY